jgi:hypothetical protein
MSSPEGPQNPRTGAAGRLRLARGYVLTSNYGYYDLAKGGVPAAIS